jgi:hypothetical protein
MLPMLASQLHQETGWRVTSCEILLGQSHTNTDESFGNIEIRSKHGITLFFGFTSSTNKKIEMDEIRIFNAENIEVCIDENDENNVFTAAYDIVDQINWRKIAINAKYEKQSRKVKSISFNRESEADILHFVENQKDFSNWVKSKILEEISKSHG